MTTLVFPSLDRRFLKALADEAIAVAVHEWPTQSLQRGSSFLQDVCEHTSDVHHRLSTALAHGVEARSFIRDATRVLPALEQQIAETQALIEAMGKGAGSAVECLSADARALERATLSLRDLVAEVLALVSAPPPPGEWEPVNLKGDTELLGSNPVTFEAPPNSPDGQANGNGSAPESH
jgi:hypothetical protein